MFISAKWISDFQSSRKELSNAWPQETGAILERDKSAFQFTQTSPIWLINHISLDVAQNAVVFFIEFLQNTTAQDTVFVTASM